MAQINRELTGVDTLFLPTSPQNSFISSSRIKEIARLGGPVADFLPPSVHRKLLDAL